MKRLTSVLMMLVVISLFSFSESFAAKRWVLIEEFTNASCGPCASQNPSFQNFLTSNLDNVIPIIFRTNFPGRDIMYDRNTTMYDARRNYYSVDGVPVARTNGKMHPASNNSYEGAPGNTQGLQQEIAKYTSGTSPISITPAFTLNGNTMKINVNVATTEAISNKVLRTAVVEAYHKYAKNQAGTNGETEFYYIVREMLPTQNGVNINIAAGASNDYSYTYDIHPSVHAPLMYVVAFVQDDASKEVLQAGASESPTMSDISKMKDVPVQVSVDASQKHGFIETGKSSVRTMKVTNPNNKEVTIGLSPNFIGPNDWTATLDKKEVTLAAGASADVNVTITAGTTLAYVAAGVDAYPINLANNELGGYASATVNALHKATKIVNYIGMGRFDDYLSAVATQSPSYKNVTNQLAVLDVDAMAAYPADNFEVTIYNFDFFGLQQASGLLGNNYTQSIAIRANIKKALDAGKDVLIFAENELAFTFGNAQATNGQNFFKQDLGIATSGNTIRVQTNQQGQITGIISYPVAGVANDPISNGLGFICNTHSYAQQGQFYGVFTDLITLEPNSKAIPFLYADNNTNNIVGIRFENPSKGKLAYISAPSAGFEIGNLMTLYNKTIDWFMSAAAEGPKVSLSVNSLSFGKVNMGSTSEKVVTIKNTGDAVMNISAITVTGDTKGVFSLGASSTTKTLAAGASLDVAVTFAPKAGETYNAQLNVKTDAINGGNLNVALSGIGEDPSHVGEIGGKFYLNVSPNPVTSVSNIKYEINNDMPVNLTINLIDAQGNNVGELFNGISGNGVYNLNLNSANYSAGAYYLSVKVDGQLNNVPVIIVK
ncbi:MAG TPA: choice-of-anchor D domain-containing protein [Candidatus Kapabacteria bacterium]|nr:choice-of-anchor D domain-containing protein [Candidatus Kapabacteria bacterium]